MTAVEAVGEPTGVTGILGNEGVIVAECAVALEVVELSGEVPGFHVVAAGGEVGPTGLHPDG